MQGKPKRPRDPNQLGKLIVALATGETLEQTPSKKAISGRAGGLKGGKTRMGGLTESERIELAKKAAATRWKKAAPSTSKVRPKPTN